MGKRNFLALSFIAVVLVGTAFVFSNTIKNTFFGSEISVKPVAIESEKEMSKIASTLSLAARPLAQCQEGWKEYHQDALGLAFCYPETWGDMTISASNVSTDKSEDLTNLSLVTGKSIALNFSKSLSFDGLSTPSFIFFNEEYVGEGYPNGDYMHIPIDTIPDLRKSGDICQYTTQFQSSTYPNTIKELSPVCRNGVKEVILQHKQVFRGDIGVLYSYDVKELAYRKMGNGYFDHMLITYPLASTLQVKDATMTLEKTLSLHGNYTGRVLPVSSEMYEQRKKDFSTFIESIRIFQPQGKQASQFQSISGEDANVTTIRKYYWLVDAGKLEEAYAMRANASADGIGNFTEDYKNVYRAEPFDFKKVGENRYDLYVRYQDKNAPEEKFKVTMEVHANTVSTLFLEEYLSDVVTFGDMTAYAVRRGDKDYMILNRAGKEIILDQGKKVSPEGYFISFGDPKFSPQGSYLTYRMFGWENSNGRVYDIRAGKEMKDSQGDDWSFVQGFSFTEDEKYFYICSNSGIASGPGGKVYSVPGFNTEYNILSDVEVGNFMNVNCVYDKINNVIVFTADNEELSQDMPDANVVSQWRFDLLTGKSQGIDEKGKIFFFSLGVLYWYI